MTTISSYAIGTTVGGLTNLETLAGFGRPPRGYLTLYPVKYVGGSSQDVGDGLPTCKWVFRSLSQAQVNALRAYVSSGSTYLLSAPVYITTRLDDGSFATFSAFMNWPQDMESKRTEASGLYENLEIIFTAMVQQ
jgi:hypothetical protein